MHLSWSLLLCLVVSITFLNISCSADSNVTTTATANFTATVSAVYINTPTQIANTLTNLFTATVVGNTATTPPMSQTTTRSDLSMMDKDIKMLVTVLLLTWIIHV